MKKVLIVIFALMFCEQVFASCSIDMDKPCTASALDRVHSSVRSKYIPSPLEDMKKTDAFQPQFVVPYQKMLINTETKPVENYNSNCQFGVCLPEKEPSGSVVE